ncbi:MAG: DUF1289 domain-containing protein [Hyphomicrobium sp.]
MSAASDTAKTAASVTSPTSDTPCVKICVIEPKSRLCKGCKRSIDEIAAWSGLSSAERRRIMATLDQRTV